METAKERAARARERSRRAAQHGDEQNARVHAHTAELHEDAAEKAATLLHLDQQIEGDRLD
jgi:hypothetical protein